LEEPDARSAETSWPVPITSNPVFQDLGVQAYFWLERSGSGSVGSYGDWMRPHPRCICIELLAQERSELSLVGGSLQFTLKGLNS